jgi:tricorn protease
MKTLNRATIVGVQTPGAVIGTNDITLSDGTRWRLPRTGFFNWDGKNQEHNGCEPDIEVRIDPADLLAGKDTQLEQAIEVAVEQVKGPAKSKPEGPPEPTQPTKPEKTGEFTEPAALPWE